MMLKLWKLYESGTCGNFQNNLKASKAMYDTSATLIMYDFHFYNPLASKPTATSIYIILSPMKYYGQAFWPI